VTCTATGTAQIGQYANLGIATGTPAGPGGVFEGVEPVTSDDPSHYVGVFPPNDVCDTFGSPKALTMMLNSIGMIDTAQDPSKVIVTPVVSVPLDDDSTVYILATDKADPNDASAKVWFAGNVMVGSTFVIDAANAGASKLANSTFVYVYSSEQDPDDGVAPLQSITFHTSCSQELGLGDQFGHVQLFGFQDDDGNSTEGASVGDTVWNDTNGNGKQDSGEPGIPEITVTLGGDSNGTKTTDANGKYLFGGLDPGSYTVTVHVSDVDLPQFVTESTAPEFTTTLAEGQGFLTADFGFTSTVCGGAKPQALTFSYNGNLGSFIRVTDKSNPFDGGGKVFFAGEVDGVDPFTAYSKLAGSSEFPSTSYIHVYAANGDLVASITVKTDCSQPLYLGQTFGIENSFVLVGFVRQGDPVPDPLPPLVGPIVPVGPIISGKNVDFRLVNFGASQVIDSINITWPVVPNKKLQRVKLDGATLFDKKLTGPTQTLPDAGVWKGNVGDRTVTPGDIGLLRFEFEANAATSGYTITINYAPAP
jgi:hypothetical protein